MTDPSTSRNELAKGCGMALSAILDQLFLRSRSNEIRRKVFGKELGK